MSACDIDNIDPGPNAKVIYTQRGSFKTPESALTRFDDARLYVAPEGGFGYPVV